MFEPGDKVICINIVDSDSKLALTLYKVYQIVESDNIRCKIIINDDNNNYSIFFNFRFISLKEYRKRKLEKLKLCSK